MEIGEYLRLARAHWVALASFLLIGIIGSGLIALSATPQYTATSEVLVVTGAGSASELAQTGDYSQKQVRTFSAVATRPIVLDSVIDNLGLDTTADQLARQVSVSSPLNTLLLSIRVTDASPSLAADIANGIAEELARVVDDVVPTSEDGKPFVSLETIRSAVAPQHPSAPNTKVLLAMGVVLGLVAGVVVVAVRETLNTKVRSDEDVAAIVPATQLGVIEHVASRDRTVITGSIAHTPYAESFRHLRTGIKFVGAVEPHKLLPVTSSINGEGKSTVACNLAITLAADGERVCLVDADLRRPRLGDYLGLESMVGLTTVLVGDSSIADVVQPWGALPLDVLLSGQTPPNPSELLGSERMTALLEDLRERYDYVVIDCPPIVPVTDGSLVAKACGGAIFVVGSGRVDSADLHRAVTTLQALDTPILGTVLNMVPQKTMGVYAYGYAGRHEDARPRRHIRRESRPSKRLVRGENGADVRKSESGTTSLPP